MRPCLSDQELIALNLGELPEAVMQEICAHLESCSKCEQRVRNLDSACDPVIHLLRRPGPHRPANLGGTRPIEPTSRSAPFPVDSTAESESIPQQLSFLDPPTGPDELGWLAQYRVQKLLGRGGMGMVFRAEDTHLQRPVALKVMRPDLGQDPVARQRFLREARAAAAIRDDHIVTIYQVGQAKDVCFLAMEFLEGESLGDRLKRGTPLSLTEVLRVIRQVAEGLAAAHARGLIHRDIKPDNVWIEPGGRIKLLDFGLARAAADDNRLTQTGFVLGTPGYLAPEQARGEGGDGRLDLFSLGCLLYRLLTGKVPFEGPNTLAQLTALAVDSPAPLRQLSPDLPEELAGLVHELLDKDPARRPASAPHVIERLRVIERRLGPSPTEQAVISPAVRVGALTPRVENEVTESSSIVAARSRLRRRRATWLLPVAGGGLAGLLVVSAFFFSRGDNQGGAKTTPGPIQPVVKGKAPADWVATVAALPAMEQIDAVARELKRLNPGFDGDPQPTVEKDQVVAVTLAEKQLTDLAPLRAFKHLRVVVANGNGSLVHLEPLRGLALEELELNNTGVREVVPLEGMPLRRLRLWNTKVTDLSPLRGMPLNILSFAGAPVRDLRPLAGMPLRWIELQGSQVDDLTPLAGMPLHRINFNWRPYRDWETLAAIPALEFINGRQAAEFWKEARAERAAFDAWCQQVAAMPAAEQAKAVAARLKEQNPEMDETRFEHKIEDGVVVELRLPVQNLVELAPVRALPKLKRLILTGDRSRKGPLYDLSPLRGLPLEELDCSYTKVRSLQPLAGLPLQALNIAGTDVLDLAPITRLPLKHLRCDFLPQRDAKPLRDIATLETLNGRPIAEFRKE